MIRALVAVGLVGLAIGAVEGSLVWMSVGVAALTWAICEVIG